MARPPLPLALRIEGKKAVIVGGGAVASRKVATLLHHGAAVTVVAPEVSAEIRARNADPALTIIEEPFRPELVDGAVLVIAATSSAAVNEEVADAARNRGIPVNIVDDPDSCDVVFAAALERGSIQVAVWTGGASPALARTLRNRLRAQLPEQYADYSEVLAAIREAAKRSVPEELRRRTLFDALVAGDLLDLLDRGAYELLVAKVRALCVDSDVEPPEELDRLRRYGSDETR